MIILDTHIWIWWTDETSKLKTEFENVIRSEQENGLGVSAISCWEIAVLHARRKIEFSVPILEWIETSLSLSNIVLLPLFSENSDRIDPTSGPV